MFITWTSHDYEIDKIIFDAAYWNKLKFVCILLQALFIVIQQVSLNVLFKTNLDKA